MVKLTDVKPGTRVIVRRIDGVEVKKHLEDIGIREGIDLKIVGTELHHKHKGPICIKISDSDKEVIIPQGIADKTNLDKGGQEVSLLALEQGDKGIVKNIQSGEAMTLLNELGIMGGAEIEFARHMPDDTLVFKIEEREMRVGEGEAAKILVELEGKRIQANYVKEGIETTIVKIIGGIEYGHKFEGIGLKEGTNITLLKKEAHPPSALRGRYIRAKIGEELITVGHGLAEKVWVEST